MERKAERFWTATPGERVEELPNPPELARTTCPCCSKPSAEARCTHCGGAAQVRGYAVQRLLGQSPHARTYLARAPDGSQVVLKELSFAVVPGVGTLEAFEREGRLLERIRHPGVPSHRESFREGEGIQTRLYLVQEYVAGASLAARVGGAPFTEAEAERLAREVLTILAHLHGLDPKVIHRDIKPANLMQRPDGSVALVDFGAARDLVKGATYNATMVGTFGYMPFEQLGGTVDPSCDLYALGATLIHLLAQKPPWEMMPEGNRIEFERHVHVSPRFLRFLQRLVARPKERFHTAQEALAALDAKGGLVLSSGARKTALAALIAAGFVTTALAAEVLGRFFKDAPALPAPPAQVERPHFDRGAVLDGFDHGGIRYVAGQGVQHAPAESRGLRVGVLSVGPGADAQAVERWVRGRRAELEDCFARAGAGALTLRFAIAPGGRLADVSASDASSASAESCVVERARGWSAPVQVDSEVPVEVPLEYGAAP